MSAQPSDDSVVFDARTMTVSGMPPVGGYRCTEFTVRGTEIPVVLKPIWRWAGRKP